MTPDVLTTTDPRWLLSGTVEAIAAGSDWAEKVAAFWALVDREAHDLAHPKPVYACPGCPQTVDCPSCGLPAVVCENSSGHGRVWREGEASLLVGSVHQGRSDTDGA